MPELMDEKGRIVDALPFSGERQQAVLGYLLTNEPFFLQCKDRIQPHWFNDPSCSLIYGCLVSWHQEFKKFPSLKDICEHPKIRGEIQERRNLVIQVAGIAATISCKEYSLEPIVAELTDWLHARTFMERVYSSRDLFNRGQFKEAYLEIDRLSREIHETTFANEKTYRFSDPIEILSRRRANVQNALTWGLSVFDRLLLPEAGGNGSLLPGTTTTIVAPTSCGKSTIMTTVAVANIARGKRVLFVPHEGNVDELRAKFLCCMMDRDLEWLNINLLPAEDGGHDLLRRQNLSEEETKLAARIRRYLAILDCQLTFMPMIRPGLPVEDVISAIRRKHDEARNIEGQGYDLVIDDYPAKLTTHEASGGKLEHRHKMEIIYATLNLLAEELGFHLLNAAQTNRDGARINQQRKGYEHRLLGMDDISEAFGPMMDIATVITANRTPFDESQHRLVLHCAKSRTGTKGWTVVCRTNYAHGITHGEQLGGTWYRGASVGTEKMEQLLDMYRDQEIPHEVEI